DGLAMSSRNAYLSPKERGAALILYRALSLAKEMIKAGERDAMTVLREMTKLIERERMAKIDYVALCHTETLEDLENIEDRALIALAVKIGKTRLIDNCLIRADG
ncbi:MAG: pantoate--beta-alanine ligase, partial [candidate division NC10 bacterium]|nr:pantoate--beta-alanine ligase [candidate division NC10 bacterium]